MNTLLVLGSKPDAVLPPDGSVTDVACANGSGRSAREAGLPSPDFTVMSAILTSGISSGTHSLDAVAGLSTETLWVLPRPAPLGGPMTRALGRLRQRSARPARLRRALSKRGYRYENFVVRSHADWQEMIRGLCGHDQQVTELMAGKAPSTGICAIAQAVSEERWQRIIVSGFSFELTHAYCLNPEIAKRGTQQSRHADTDIAVLACLARRHDHLFTTEPAVADRARVPVLPAAGGRTHGTDCS